MSRTTCVLCSIIVLAGAAMAAAKPHVITFGKSTQVRWLAGTDENTPFELKVRALYVDGKPKEFTIGSPHEITERLFVVRRAFRVNDSLPDEGAPRASEFRSRRERKGNLLNPRSFSRRGQ